MEDVDQLLKMIGEVSPEDAAKLDEIDARVWCFIDGIDFDKTQRTPWAGGQSLMMFSDTCRV